MLLGLKETKFGRCVLQTSFHNPAAVMRSILLIVDQSFPNQHAFLEEVYAKLFPENGDKVVWIFRDLNKGFRFRRTKWHNTTVYTIPNENHYGLLLTLLIRTLLFFWVFKIIHKENITLVQVRNWVFGAYVAWFYKILCRIPYVYQISFPVHAADIIIASSTRNKNKLRIWKNNMKKRLLNFAVKKADIVFVISEEMRRQMMKEGLRHPNMIPIPLGYAVSEPPSQSQIIKLAKSLGFADKKVVLYVGTLSFLREPKFMVRVLKGLTENRSDVLLLIVGGELEEIQGLAAYAKELGVSQNILFTGKVPRKKVPEYIAVADVCISPIPEIPIYLLSSPTKLFEYIGAGRPVVASRIPEQEKIIRQSGCGICTDFNEESFINAIELILCNNEERIAMGKRGAAFAKDNSSYVKIYDKVIESYSTLA